MIFRSSKNAVLVLCSGALMACALDDRVLNGTGTDSPCQNTDQCPGLGGGAAAAAGGRPNNGGDAGRVGVITVTGDGNAASGAPDTAGAAGQVQVGPPIDCPDLDQNTVLDCNETLVTNPGFRLDVKGWSPEANGVTSWESLDATGSSSGSIHVDDRGAATGPDNGLTYTGATQCVKVQPNRAYVIFAQMYARGPMVNAFGSVVGRSFASTDCSGTPLQIQTSAIEGTVSLWITLQTTVPAVMSAGSLLVELSVGKPRSVTGDAALNFDNVLVR